MRAVLNHIITEHIVLLLYKNMSKVILNEPEYKEAAARAVELAKHLLAGNENYLDNVLEICWLAEKLVGEVVNTEFHVFYAISSDTTHLPTKKVRPLCSQSMLKRSDEELISIIKHYETEVADACNKVLLKYKNV